MTILAYAPNFDTEQAMYAIIFVAIIAYNFRVGFLKVFVDYDEDVVSYAAPTPAPVVTTVASVRKKSKEPLSDDDWDEICRAAVEEAKEGDHRARDWVVKNVGRFGGATAGSRRPAAATTKNTTPKYTTPKSVIDDAVATLRSIGHTKKDATDQVNAAIKLKKYDNVESLIKDLYKKG